MRLLALLTVASVVALSGCGQTTADAPAAAPVAAAPDPASPASSAPARSPAPRSTQSVQSASPDVPRYADNPSSHEEPPRHPVYDDYRPPLSQPQPIAVSWAPPPLLAEAVPPPPSPQAWWVGGYWVWRDGWAWAPGRWEMPPRPQYHWVPPYYVHRHDEVVFVGGFWGAPGVAFVPPAPDLRLSVMVAGAGAIVGRVAIGPEGPFVPPPPGSRWGLIVPAPVGTAPVVMQRAPAIVDTGMRITRNSDNGNDHRVTRDSHNTTIDNHNATIINNIRNVTIVAPASATGNHQPFNAAVPAQPHPIAAQASVQAVLQAPPSASGRRAANPLPTAPARSDHLDTRSAAVAPHPVPPAQGPANAARPEDARPPARSPMVEREEQPARSMAHAQGAAPAAATAIQAVRPSVPAAQADHRRKADDEGTRPHAQQPTHAAHPPSPQPENERAAHESGAKAHAAAEKAREHGQKKDETHS